MPRPASPALLILPVLGLLLAPAGAARPAEALAGLAACVADGEATVTHVAAGGELWLADGGRAVLAGIALPPSVAGAQAAVEDLAASGPLSLFRCGRPTDRYGRRLVQAVTVDGRWLQGALLSRGLARVATTPDTGAAARPLLAAEAPARRWRRGLWRDRATALRSPGQMRRFVDSVQVVEGTVASTYRGRKGLDLRFGQGARPAFTVRIPTPVLVHLAKDPALAPFAEAPGGLAGQRLRVRGWIGLARGPLLEITHPEQIELAEPRRGWAAAHRAERE
jgi:micrococcal nuclease